MTSKLNDSSPIFRSIIVTAAIAILVIFLQAAESIAAPVLLAAFIAIIAASPMRWLRRKRFPKWLSLSVIVFIIIEIGSIIMLVFTGELEGFRNGLPSYQQRLSCSGVGYWEQLGSSWRYR